MTSNKTPAQTIESVFPKGLYGYDQQLGVTVLTRNRSLYYPKGIQFNNFFITPGLAQSLFYNSAVNGSSGVGSWGSRTAGSVSAASGWSRNSLNASIGFDNNQFFSLPQDAFTNWNVGLSGGYSIADSQLVAAYSHQTYSQLSTAIGVVRSATPLQDQVDTARLGYTFHLSSISVSPDLSYSRYQFGPATVAGVRRSQAFLDNEALAAGVEIRHAINQESDVLTVLRGVNLSYLSQLPGQPTNDSNSFQILGGLDYQPKSVWRYRLLAGLEVRSFDASQYGTRVAPDVEASVIWGPTGLTTLTGSLSNSIQSPQTAGTSSYTLTQFHLNADHEYTRNVILNGHGGLQYAQYDQLGTQTNLNFGGSLTWLLNRNVRFTWSYDFTKQTGGGGFSSGDYSQHLASLTLGLAL